jgi:tetratricopeptide (TPR) repeat protein
LKCHPNNAYAYLELGVIYKEWGDYPKALANFKKALTYPGLPNVEEVEEMLSSIAAGQK